VEIHQWQRSSSWDKNLDTAFWITLRITKESVFKETGKNFKSIFSWQRHPINLKTTSACVESIG
jgi:hypothetical protein